MGKIIRVRYLTQSECMPAVETQQKGRPSRSWMDSWNAKRDWSLRIFDPSIHTLEFSRQAANVSQPIYQTQNLAMSFVGRIIALFSLLLITASATPNAQPRLRDAGEREKLNGKYVPEWGQCQFVGRAYLCDKGLYCAVRNDYYGQCVKAVADPWNQCAGQTWKVSCTKDCDCVYKNPYYSQCVPKSSQTAKGTV